MASAAKDLRCPTSARVVDPTVAGGISGTGSQPELDPLNYAPRIAIPVLMLNGKYDYIYPVDTSQLPLFERLGMPPEHKRYVSFEAGHGPFPKSEWIPAALKWLEKYVGPLN